VLYLIGSLRNPRIPGIAHALRKGVPGLEVFDDWYAAGPDADDCWKAYERLRGRSFIEALQAPAARNVFNFDKKHLDRCSMAALVLPAGRSAHLELGYVLGSGKPGFILLPQVEAEDQTEDRWDVMYQFANAVFPTTDELVKHVRIRHVPF
jgi:hypothetical protein